MEEQNESIKMVGVKDGNRLILITEDEFSLWDKCDNFYNPQAEAGIQLRDEALGIDWKIPTKEAILSEKDLKYPYLKDMILDFDINEKYY